MQALAFVDLETTGATAATDRITEIGIVTVNDHGITEWSSLVNPETAIPPFIQSMTGITDAMVQTAPTFAQIADEVLARLHGHLFIAHNARFDYSFLKQEFLRCQHHFRATVLCTVKLSRKLFPEHRRHGLDALIERHKLKVDGRHRALADAQLIHQFWTQAQQLHTAEHFALTVETLLSRQTLPSHIDPDVADQLPSGPGVYLFYGENDQPLYISKARDIRKRVLSHFAKEHASKKEMSLAQQLRRIDWICTGGELGASLQEVALARQLQPLHNRQLRRNDEACVIHFADQYAAVPDITAIHDVDQMQQRELFGPFKSSKEARKVIAELTTTHGQKLRQALMPQRLKSWPFSGAACIKEGEEVLVADHWCYLGAAKTDAELPVLLEQRRPTFDPDIYRILAKSADRLIPL